LNIRWLSVPQNAAEVCAIGRPQSREWRWLFTKFIMKGAHFEIGFDLIDALAPNDFEDSHRQSTIRSPSNPWPET